MMVQYCVVFLFLFFLPAILKHQGYMSGFDIGSSESDGEGFFFYRAAILHQYHTDIVIGKKGIRLNRPECNAAMDGTCFAYRITS